MILSLFGILALISLVLIIMGLSRPSESAMALIGFVFLFFLSLVLINGTLQVEAGSHINTTYGYDGSDRVNETSQVVHYQYQNFNDSTSRQMGFYLVLAAVIGFAGVWFAWRRSRKNDIDTG